MFDKLSRSNCVHYAIECDSFVDVKEITKILIEKMQKDMFIVKRIVKEKCRFIRISICKEVDKDLIKLVLINVRILLKCKINILKMKLNSNMKNKKKTRVEATSIFSLNINRIKNKMEEFAQKISERRYTIICLQETGNGPNDKRVFVQNYKTVESRAENGRLGMLIGVRKDCDLLVKVIEKNECLILISINSFEGKIYLANIYKKINGPLSIKIMEDIKRLFIKYENERIIMVGDWNQLPKEILGYLR